MELKQTAQKDDIVLGQLQSADVPQSILRDETKLNPP